MAMIVVLSSGGINSAVTAARARQVGDVHLVHADFGQPQSAAQRQAVRKIADHLRAAFTSLDMPHVAQAAALSRPAGDAPVATAEGSSPSAASLDTMARVPGLITVLLGAAVQIAARVGAGVIQVGSSEAADEAEIGAAAGGGTPAHRREVYYLYNVLLERLQRSKSPIRLEAPLWDLTRAEIIKLGMRYNTPFDWVYSCITGKTPCGACPDCTARQKAFAAAEITDPRAVATMAMA